MGDPSTGVSTGLKKGGTTMYRSCPVPGDSVNVSAAEIVGGCCFHGNDGR